jgi:hypothetical protein
VSWTLTLMMETELVSETLVLDSKLTRLIGREDFITFMGWESFKYYKDLYSELLYHRHRTLFRRYQDRYIAYFYLYKY